MRFSLRQFFILFTICSFVFAGCWWKCSSPIQIQVCGNDIVVVNGTGMPTSYLASYLADLQKDRKAWFLNSPASLTVNEDAATHNVNTAVDAIHDAGIVKLDVDTDSSRSMDSDDFSVLVEYGYMDSKSRPKPR